jgi:hypothetical protein
MRIVSCFIFYYKKEKENKCLIAIFECRLCFLSVSIFFRFYSFDLLLELKQTKPNTSVFVYCN